MWWARNYLPKKINPQEDGVEMDVEEEPPKAAETGTLVLTTTIIIITTEAIEVITPEIKVENRKISFLFILSLFWLSACQDGKQLASMEFENNCWEISDSLSFQIDYENIEMAKNPMMAIDFLHDYPDRNIFIKAWITDPGDNVREVLLEDILFDVEGNWLKTEGTPDFVLKRTFPIDPTVAGTYQVKLTQFTRHESLCNIESVEIRY